jgi:DNA-binding NarL/FixJ family response regulator
MRSSISARPIAVPVIASTPAGRSSGLAIAEQGGATALAQHARIELGAAGARPRKAVRTGVDSLTPSELRVATMAATGLKNREIAQSLFITLKGVEAHLHHTYQKPDIASRDQLRDALG